MSHSVATLDVSILVTSVLLIKLNGRVVASALVLVLVVGTAAGYLIGVTRQGTTTTTTETLASTSVSRIYSTSLLTTSNVASVTSPCGSPGVYCGGFNITSASLMVNGNYSILRVTILEIGNMYIGSATVYVNGTVIGNPPASQYEPPGNVPLNVQPGQQAVIVLTIPSSAVPIRVGMAYSVLVYDWEGPPGQRASSGGPASINIVAD